jgi:hypothetical protein
MESAEGIIAVMKQAGLEPNDDTYATLMRGFAKKGDIENIKRIVKVSSYSADSILLFEELQFGISILPVHTILPGL